ncbi:hypothetical protein PFUGPA_02952, partial [Plasmodium falciparum Palo Alto/Uganda]
YKNIFKKRKEEKEKVINNLHTYYIITYDKCEEAINFHNIQKIYIVRIEYDIKDVYYITPFAYINLSFFLLSHILFI